MFEEVHEIVSEWLTNPDAPTTQMLSESLVAYFQKLQVSAGIGERGLPE